VITVSNLAASLRALFTTSADALALETTFVKRTRIITGANFTQALVFGWLENPDATLEDLAMQLGVTPQALHDRFNPTAHTFLQRILAQALRTALRATPPVLTLLQSFTRVYADDCTTISLPADAATRWPGCGGHAPDVGAAALKAFTRWELTTGAIESLNLFSGRTPDLTAAQSALEPEPGSLVLADMGFFDLARFRTWTSTKVSWITRIPAQVTLTCDGRTQGVATYLGARPEGTDTIDIPILLGGLGVPCRLVARRCPEAVRVRREAKQRETASRKQRRVSADQLVLCGWTVYATNVPAAVLNPVEMWMVARVRWQVELLFKGWKSQGGVARSQGRTGDRVECEVLAKLVGQIVCQWGLLLRGGPLVGVNQVAARRFVQRRARLIRFGLGNEDALLVTVLTELERELQRLKIPKRKQRVSTSKSLSHNHLTT